MELEVSLPCSQEQPPVPVLSLIKPSEIWGAHGKYEDDCNGCGVLERRSTSGWFITLMSVLSA
jgi:hypothetical protein